MKLKTTFWSSIIAVLIFMGCSKSKEIIMEISEGVSPLQLVAKIQNDSFTGRIVVMSGIDTIKSKYTDDSIIVLNGLVPNMHYNCFYETINGDFTDVVEYKTSSVQHSLYNYSVRGDTSYLKGFVFLKHYNGIGYHSIVNNQGELVWMDDENKEVIRAFQLLDSNTYISLIDSINIVEKDMRGNTINRIKLLEGDIKFHHDVTKKGALIYVIIYDRRINSNGLEVKGDAIIALNNVGKVVWRWSVFDEIDIDNLKFEDLNNNEYGHANSIFVDDDNVFVSFRDFNQIWKINRLNNRILWKLGENGDFKLRDSSFYFYKQHSIHLNSKGDLMFYDNGDNKIRPNSRVVSFNIDEINMTVSQNINITLPKKYSSYRMGSAFLINDSSVLVCASKKILNVGVFTLEGDLKWELTSSNDSYRAYFLESL